MHHTFCAIVRGFPSSRQLMRSFWDAASIPLHIGPLILPSATSDLQLFRAFPSSLPQQKAAGGTGPCAHEIRAPGAFVKGTGGASDGPVPMPRACDSALRSTCRTPYAGAGEAPGRVRRLPRATRRVGPTPSRGMSPPRPRETLLSLLCQEMCAVSPWRGARSLRP